VTIFRVQNPEFFDVVKEHLLQQELDNQEAYVAHLKGIFVNSPQAMFVIAAADEQGIAGFMVVIAADGMKSTFVLHTYARAGLPTEIADRAFGHVLGWTMSIGRLEVRTETIRRYEAVQRRWGYQHHSTVMSYKIDSNMNPLDFMKMNHKQLAKKEETDGRSISTEISVNTVGQPEGGRLEHLQTSAEPIQPARDAGQAEGVQGANSSNTGPGVSNSSGPDRQLQSEPVQVGNGCSDQQSVKRETSIQPGPSNDGQVV
jgi:hypothetical protein